MKFSPLLIASILSLGSAFAGTSNPEPQSTSAVPKLSETVFTVDVLGADVGVIGGASIVQPLFSVGGLSFSAEGYGQKGEQSFGTLGGGLLIRKQFEKVGTFGVNGFVEGLQDKSGFAYQEVGVGLEYGARCMILRSNVYLPFGDAGDTRTLKDSDCGCTEGITETKAATGWDVNLELALPKHPQWIDPRLIVGYYGRSRGDGFGNYSGATLGTEIHFFHHFTALAEWRENGNRSGQEWITGLRLEIPLGRCTCSSGKGWVTTDLAEELMHLPARRNPWPTSFTKTTSSSLLKGRSSDGEGLGSSSSPLLIFN